MNVGIYSWDFFNLRKSRLQSLLSLNPLSLQLYLIENLVMFAFSGPTADVTLFTGLASRMATSLI